MAQAGLPWTDEEVAALRAEVDTLFDLGGDGQRLDAALKSDDDLVDMLRAEVDTLFDLGGDGLALKPRPREGGGVEIFADP